MKRINPNKFKAGTHVRSHYRAPWYGIVVSCRRRKDCAPLVTIRRTHDRRHNPVRKEDIVTLDASWLEVLDD